MSEQANSSQVGNASATLDGKNQPSWNDFFVRLDEQEVFHRWTPSWLNLEIGENSWKSSKFHRKTTDKWNFIMFDNFGSNKKLLLKQFWKKSIEFDFLSNS